jgi:hypothetical protein
MNLCDTEILKLDYFLNQVGTPTDSIPKNKNHESINNGQRKCTRIKQSGSQGNEYLYSIQFIINDFVIDDTREQELVNLSFEGLSDIKNETILINYFSYQV